MKLKQDQLMPKKKFAFKSRKKDALPSEEKSSEDKPEPTANISVVASSVKEESVGFRDRKNEKLQLNVSRKY